MPKGKVVSQGSKILPEQGPRFVSRLTLSDAGALRRDRGAREGSNFQGRLGRCDRCQTGEILALTSYPEYSMQATLKGDKDAFAALMADKRQPFLNRAVSGLYAPGSIVKPIMGVAALTEGVIDENKQILSTGSISLPNPYDPTHPSIFKDWRPQRLGRLCATRSQFHLTCIFMRLAAASNPARAWYRKDRSNICGSLGSAHPRGSRGLIEPSGHDPNARVEGREL
jgi:hypothetical protein